MKHIEFEKLIDKFEGRLSEADAKGVSSHIDRCPACDSEYRKLEDLFGYISLTPDVEVPQAATANILNIYQRRPVVERARESLLSKVGILVFDDWTTALNERYAGMDSRQMLYNADGFDIDLRIEFVGDKCIVAGQVFPECAGAEVTLVSDEIAHIVTLNDMSEFAFVPVATGDYSLRIENDEIEIVIDNIPLHI